MNINFLKSALKVQTPALTNIWLAFPLLGILKRILIASYVTCIIIIRLISNKMTKVFHLFINFKNIVWQFSLVFYRAWFYISK